MSVIPCRRAAVAAGTVLLALAAVGCSGLDRTAVGTLTYESGHGHHTTVTSPGVTECHRFGEEGAVAVENETEVDVILHPSEDCAGTKTTYVESMSSDDVAPGAGVWRSYSFVH